MDNYLTLWELVANLLDHKVIAEDMVFDAFAYEIEKTYRNRDIISYILKTRNSEGTPDLYEGFTLMAERFLRLDSKKEQPSNRAKR